MAIPKAPVARFGDPKLPDGRPLTSAELERCLLQEVEDSGGTSRAALWNLAKLYSETKRHDQAFECVKKLASLVANPDEAASCYLAMGQLSEQLDDYPAAVRYYQTALGLNRERAASWYWIHNNLGYSLIRLGYFQRATKYLEVALTIDRTRPNAFKNLGLAMQAMNENAKAAEFFVAATLVNAADGRALNHLEKLVAKHPYLLTENRGLRAKLDACRSAVGRAAPN
jgi:tetratricopeptide (TPR) repeat protein